MLKTAILSAVVAAVSLSTMSFARADDHMMERHMTHQRMEHHMMERHMMHQRMEHHEMRRHMMMRHDM